MRVIFHPKCSRCQVLNNPNELHRSRYRGKEVATALLVHGARGFNLQVPEHALYSSWLVPSLKRNAWHLPLPRVS